MSEEIAKTALECLKVKLEADKASSESWLELLKNVPIIVQSILEELAKLKSSEGTVEPRTAHAQKGE